MKEACSGTSQHKQWKKGYIIKEFEVMEHVTLPLIEGLPVRDTGTTNQTVQRGKGRGEIGMDSVGFRTRKTKTNIEGENALGYRQIAPKCKRR